MSTGTPAPISVVIPNLDGAAWLSACLVTLLEGVAPPAEVIVADDGSHDDSGAITLAAGARFLPGGPRTGWAATSNRGLRAATHDWVLLLNNDTEVAPGAIAALHAAARRHPGAAFLAPLVRSLRDRRTIDSAGLLLYPDGVARPRWHGLPDPPEPPREEEVLLPSGAALLVHTMWLRTAGGFDEGFHSYCEDVDWALRCARVGGRGWFVPDAVVYHQFSGSFGALSSRKARFVERNRIVVAVRHLPAAMLLASPVWTARRWLALGCVVSSANAERRPEPGWRVAAAALAGFVQGLTAVPRALRERRRLAEGATADARGLARRIRRFRASPGDMRTFGARGGGSE